MNAAVLHDIDGLSLMHVPAPEPGPGEALLKIEVSTTCDTDLHIVSGAKTARVHPGVILDHEFAGRAVAVGEGVERVDVGVQVICSIVLSCSRCPQCLTGRERLHESLRLFGYEIDGGLAEYLPVPRGAMEHDNLMLVPHELELATFVLARPASCCLNGARQLRVGPGGVIVVLGTELVRLLHVALTRLAGATRIVTVGCPGCLDSAFTLGVTHTPVSQGKKLTRGIPDAAGSEVNVAVVAAGDPAPANQALEVATIGGQVDYSVGFPKGLTTVMGPSTVHYRELQVTDDSNACRVDVRRTMELLSSDALDVGSLVTHQLPLTRIGVAIAAVHECTGLKVVVVPD